MQILLNNLNWMSVNLSLALIPLVLTALLHRKNKPIATYSLLFAWFLFLPNTIYLITDLQYLPRQIFRVGGMEQVFLLAEFLFLTFFGVFSYIAALAPAKILIKKLRIQKKNENIFYILLHFIVAFGVVLGKTQRTHSWYVLTDTFRVIRDVRTVLSSPSLIFLALSFGFVVTIIFFVSRKCVRN